MRQNALNVFLFVLLAGGMTVLWWYADQNWLPKQDRPKKEPEPVAEKKPGDAKPPPARPTPEAVAALAGGASAGVAALPPPPRPEVKPAPPAPPPPKPEPATLIALGDPRFNNQVLLTTRGGAVQQVVVPAFDEATRLGQRRKGPDGTPLPLFLVPGIAQPHGLELRDDPPIPELGPGKAPDPADPNTPPGQRLVEPSYTLLHYRTPDDKHPDPLLGEINWKVVPEQRPDDGPHRVVFETDALAGAPYFLKIRKVFTLDPKDYHIGLRVEFERLPGGEKGQGKFRYQISGPRGLPIEGEWYTPTYRVALIGWETRKGAMRRQYEDAGTVAMKRGGDAVPRGENTLRYAVVINQYFASGVVVDDAAEGAARNPWEYVRATTELPFDKEYDPNRPYFEDLTVRAVAEPLDLAPGEVVAHSYLLYNGPAKVRLLQLLRGDRAVDRALVDRYHDTLGLRTLTDYRSPTPMGAFADTIYWTDLVITFTNLMHWLLGVIHYAVPNWGLSIIFLTVIVRLILLIPSKKQTQMNLKMIEIQKKLKPELDALKEKYKDDFHALNREKTRLMMQHGMNPFVAMGGCLLLIAQMPIMMGLYFALQESIFFRLEPFLWIENLAAPDMTVWWSEQIPFISTPDNIGSLLYLGPYLNILPILAVGLMIHMQNKMMPPPTDEQMAAQQRMMKIMMLMMAVLFYKVAAGLCLYFIATTVWGMIERRLIRKPEDKPGDDTGTTAGLMPRGGSPNGTAAPPRPKGFFGKLRDAMRQKMEELQKRAEEQAARQIRNKPGRQEPIRNPDRPNGDRRDRKKKRK